MDKLIMFTTVIIGLLLLFFGILFISKPFYIGRNLVTVVVRVNAHASMVVTAGIITAQGILMWAGKQSILHGVEITAYWLTELLVALLFCVALIVYDTQKDTFNTLDKKLFNGGTYFQARRKSKAKILCVIGIILITTVSSTATLMLTSTFMR